MVRRTLTIEADYRLITPLFSSGAHPQVEAELRPSSLKGVLRFWWRALAWARLGADLKRIREEESCLFGSAQDGQSRVLLRLLPLSVEPSVLHDDKLCISADIKRVIGVGARYLGYGLVEAFDRPKRHIQAGALIRACIQAPLDFTVRLRCRELDRCQPGTRSIVDALKALGTLGGLGSRSRRGYGSLTLRALRVDGVQEPFGSQTPQQLGEAIKSYLPQPGPNGRPQFTAVSAKSRYALVWKDGARPLELLDLVGREMVRFRSWGLGGKILENLESERNFQDDHDLMKRQARDRDCHPRRIAFGLPHNCGGPDQAVRPLCSDRRASPLFIHIHECGTTPVAVLSFLPADFLPPGKGVIRVGSNSVPLAPEDQLYQPIEDFLDRLLNQKGKRRKEAFTDAMEVR